MTKPAETVEPWVMILCADCGEEQGKWPERLQGKVVCHDCWIDGDYMNRPPANRARTQPPWEARVNGKDRGQSPIRLTDEDLNRAKFNAARSGGRGPAEELSRVAAAELAVARWAGRLPGFDLNTPPFVVRSTKWWSKAFLRVFRHDPMNFPYILVHLDPPKPTATLFGWNWGEDIHRDPCERGSWNSTPYCAQAKEKLRPMSELLALYDRHGAALRRELDDTL